MKIIIRGSHYSGLCTVESIGLGRGVLKTEDIDVLQGLLSEAREAIAGDSYKHMPGYMDSIVLEITPE